MQTVSKITKAPPLVYGNIKKKAEISQSCLFPLSPNIRQGKISYAEAITESRWPPEPEGSYGFPPKTMAKGTLYQSPNSNSISSPASAGGRQDNTTHGSRKWDLTCSQWPLVSKVLMSYELVTSRIHISLIRKCTVCIFPAYLINQF